MEVFIFLVIEGLEVESSLPLIGWTSIRLFALGRERKVAETGMDGNIGQR